jgi:hypothetical protein
VSIIAQLARRGVIQVETIALNLLIAKVYLMAIALYMRFASLFCMVFILLKLYGLGKMANRLSFVEQALSHIVINIMLITFFCGLKHYVYFYGIISELYWLVLLNY